MKIPTLTLNQVVQRLRKLGVSTSETTVARAIKRGLYPWGICVPAEPPRSNDRFEIYEVLFDRWVAERAVDEAGDSLASREYIALAQLQDTTREAG